MFWVKDLLWRHSPFGIGRIVQDGFVFRQNFSIRSYEIGADRTASIDTLMNHLQVRSYELCDSYSHFVYN